MFSGAFNGAPNALVSLAGRSFRRGDWGFPCLRPGGVANVEHSDGNDQLCKNLPLPLERPCDGRWPGGYLCDESLASYAGCADRLSDAFGIFLGRDVLNRYLYGVM
jgi:hypothetical protein